ncbi:MAG: polyprenyl synthetase family protein [Candidatus Symbiodolus clandestinus]
MGLQAIYQQSQSDLAAIDTLIRTQLLSSVPLVNQISQHILHSGGKRLRPLIALSTAKMLQCPQPAAVSIATWIELIHTATLLHDDVVDGSEKRRGKETAHRLFGNTASILVGDFIYTRAFQLMMELQSLPLLQLMAETTHKIAQGELLQLTHCYNPQQTEADYLQIIDHKTVPLFTAATQSAALLMSIPEPMQQALQTYGEQLGRAYQLVDDLLDYQATAEKLGKNIGDDLQEGKITLPLLHLLQNAPSTQSASIREAILNGRGYTYFDTILLAMQHYGSLDYVQKLAETAISQAITSLKALPMTPERQTLVAIANAVLQPLYALKSQSIHSNKSLGWLATLFVDQ